MNSGHVRVVARKLPEHLSQITLLRANLFIYLCERRLVLLGEAPDPVNEAVNFDTRKGGDSILDGTIPLGIQKLACPLVGKPFDGALCACL